MASVNWQKFKSTQQVKSVLRHDCKDTRMVADHMNEHIDLTRVSQNTGIWDTYAEAAERYDVRMAELPPPTRKDAVVGLGFSIPVPLGLRADQEDKWFNRVFELMGDQYGKQNIACFAVHRDEVHEYLDVRTNKMVQSRVHGQGILIPESNGRLCAKEVTARSKMVKINNAIHTMTAVEFGLEWMDGSCAKSKGNVEHLKAMSLKAELAEKQTELAKRERQLRRRETDLEARESRLEADRADLTALRVKTRQRAEEAAEALQRAADEQKRMEQEKQRLAKERREFDFWKAEQGMNIQKRQEALDEREEQLDKRERRLGRLEAVQQLPSGNANQGTRSRRPLPDVPGY